MSDRYDRLVAHVFEQMANDDEDQSQMLADIYMSADDAGKDVLDRAFICLCGWQLQTLMKQVDGARRREVDQIHSPPGLLPE